MRVKHFFASVFLLILALTAAAQDDSRCAPLRFTAWPQTDFCTASVNLDEIISGGPGKDGIPALTDPVMETVESASTWLAAQSPMIMVTINGEARAYPQAILIWHEIANDRVGGVPVAVTFCPLCNSSIVFDRRVGEVVLEFGVSGNLRKSDMVMYDRQTESWWQQFTGESIVGQYTGTLLAIIPSQVVGFGQFAARYPDGLVMSRDTGYSRTYGANPYSGYESLDYPFLFDDDLDERLPPFEHVLAGVIGATPMAYPFSILREQGVINDMIDGEPVVAFWQPGVVSALDKTRIDDSRDIGTAALFSRDINGEILSFKRAEDGTIEDEQTGSAWSAYGEALDGRLQGTVLIQRIAAPHFWFAWVAFYPATRIYGQ